MIGALFKGREARNESQAQAGYTGYSLLRDLEKEFNGFSVEDLQRSGLDLVEYLHRNLGYSYEDIAKRFAIHYKKEFATSISEPVSEVHGRLLGANSRKRYHYLPSLADVVIPKTVYLSALKSAKSEEAGLYVEGEVSSFVYEEVIKRFKGAKITDVFVDADRDFYTISYKELGGGRRFYKTVSNSLGRRIVEHLKVMASKDSEVSTTITDSPQSGKIFYKELDLEIRIEFIPTPLGECVSMRFLDIRGYFNTRLEELGYSEELVGILREIAKKAQGFVLVGGPTGSGKSTMIKSVLLEMEPDKRVIRAVEDPVEVVVQGVTHVQVNPNLSFAQAIRSFMRANPDVIFVGEIRDGETAMAFLEASMTGHLALSTIHANNSIDNLQRLAIKLIETSSMGEQEVFRAMASNLLVSLSTRLLKKRDGSGVVPLVEIFVPDDHDRELLERGEFLKLLQRQREKGKDLLSEGQKLISLGIVSREEVEKYILSV